MIDNIEPLPFLASLSIVAVMWLVILVRCSPRLRAQLERARHVATDPACRVHRPPRGWWTRARFERGRGRHCPTCTGRPR